MVQNTFIKLLEKSVSFENPEHEKAWLIVTASNLCRNHLKHWWQKRADIEDQTALGAEDKEEESRLLELVMNLPENYRAVLYLYYYEGYDTGEISKMMNKPASTVRNDLMRARKRLKDELEEDTDEKQ